MIALVLTLVVLGVALYLIDTLPMSPPIKTLIRLVVVICVVFFLLRAFGVADIPVPQIR